MKTRACDLLKKDASLGKKLEDRTSTSMSIYLEPKETLDLKAAWKVRVVCIYCCEQDSLGSLDLPKSGDVNWKKLKETAKRELHVLDSFLVGSQIIVDRKVRLLHAESMCMEKNEIYHLTIAQSITPIQKA